MHRFAETLRNYLLPIMVALAAGAIASVVTSVALLRSATADGSTARSGFIVTERLVGRVRIAEGRGWRAYSIERIDTISADDLPTKQKRWLRTVDMMGPVLDLPSWLTADLRFGPTPGAPPHVRTVLTAGFPVAAAYRVDDGPIDYRVVGLVLNGLVFAVVAAAGMYVLWVVRRLWRSSLGRCAGCAYDLRGLPIGARCPECGRRPF